MVTEKQMIPFAAAKDYINANYPNDPLLRTIALALLDQLQKVDAVEVVRCRECKFWAEGRHHTGRCKALVDFHDAERYVTDAGHFCSYGERKDNE